MKWKEVWRTEMRGVSILWRKLLYPNYVLITMAVVGELTNGLTQEKSETFQLLQD